MILFIPITLDLQTAINFILLKQYLIKPWRRILNETPFNSSQTEKELSDGRLLVTARVPDTLQFEQWLMSFGADVEVLAPKALRAKFKELALKLKDIY